MMIETERLILRPFCDSDADSLFTYAKDPDVGPIAGWPAHKSAEDTLFVIRNVLNGPECYAICEKGKNVAIGSIEIKLFGRSDLARNGNECELGFWLGKTFWGKGYMPEAAHAILGRAFEDLGMAAVWCGYYDGNDKSRRAQEKMGFRYHHTEKNSPVRLLNEVRTIHANCLTREEYKAQIQAK